MTEPARTATSAPVAGDAKPLAQGGYVGVDEITYCSILQAAKASEFGPWHAVKPNDITLCGREVNGWGWNIGHAWNDKRDDLRCERCVRFASVGKIDDCGNRFCGAPHAFRYGNALCKGSDAARLLFVMGKCVVCGHLWGDHEKFPFEDVWTCDDDGCNERVEHCTPPMPKAASESGGS